MGIGSPLLSLLPRQHWVGDMERGELEVVFAKGVFLMGRSAGAIRCPTRVSLEHPWEGCKKGWGSLHTAVGSSGAYGEGEK